MQDFPAKNFSSADSKKPEEVGELEEIFEWEDEIDLAKEIAEIGKNEPPVQEIPIGQIEKESTASSPQAKSGSPLPKEKFDIREDISQNFFAVNPASKKGGLLQAAIKLRNIQGFDSNENEKDSSMNFSIAIPNFGEEEFLANKKNEPSKKSLLAKAMSITPASSEVICQDADGIFSINAHLETGGVLQDSSFKQLVDSVLKN